MRLKEAYSGVAPPVSDGGGIGWQRGIVGVAVLLAWLAIEAASAGANLTFALSWAGPGPHQIIIGGFAIASDQLKALTPVAMIWCVAERRWLGMFACAMIFAATLGFSVLAATGYASEFRAGFFDVKSVAASKNADTIEALQKLKLDAGFVPTHRPLEVVQADIANRKFEKGFVQTANCTLTDARYTAFCNGYRQLLAEQAAASSAEKIDAKITASRTEVAKVDAVGGDRQVVLMSKLTGWAPENVLIGLVMSVVILCETGSVLGLSVATAILAPSSAPFRHIGWVQPKRADTSPPAAPTEAPAKLAPVLAPTFGDPATGGGGDGSRRQLTPLRQLHELISDGPRASTGTVTGGAA